MKLNTGGHSAGAHLITLLSLNEEYMEKLGCSKAEMEERLKGIIGISGVYDIPKLCALDGSWKQWLARHVYGIPAFGENPNLHREASPIFHVKSFSPIPFFLVSSTDVCYLLIINYKVNAQVDHWLLEDALTLKNLLEEVKVEVSHRIIPSTNHRTIIRNFGRTQDPLFPLFRSFIFNHLSSSTSSSTSSAFNSNDNIM